MRAFTKVIALSVLLVSSVINAEPPKNFSSAKRLAGKLFSSNPYTLYCHCPYDKYKKIDLKSCGMSDARKIKRAKRLEWEHMMPVSTYIKHYRCGREKLCTKKNGKRYGGRKCCEKIDKAFQQAESELYNLWPAVGLVNGTRRDYSYAMLGGKQSFYGCAFKLDKQSRKVEPDSTAKGIVARASLFMSDKYRIRLSKSQRKMFEAWDKLNPPTKRELEWAKKVAAIEGYSNPYITRHTG
jgi:deoxyribonuclease-1